MADPNDTPLPPAIISRADAKAARLKRYFLGGTCGRGHTAERYVSTQGCVACLKLTSAVSYAANPEPKKASSRAYNAANAETIRPRKKAYAAANPEVMKRAQKKYRPEKRKKEKAARALLAPSPDELLACHEARRVRERERNRLTSAARYAANPEMARRKSREWARAHPDKIREDTRAYKRANPEVVATQCRNRTARKKAAEGRHTSEDIQRIYTEQHGKCAYCKWKVGKNYHVDHITPLSKGGSNWPSNLQILCPSCNCSKHNKDPIEFMQSLGLLL